MDEKTILLLYNEPSLPSDHPDAESESDILFTADAIGRILLDAGYRLERLGVRDRPEDLLAGLRATRADLVFNLYEGMANFGPTEAYAAGLLEWLRLPFTGSPAAALTIARNKPLTKTLLSGAGIPTAPFIYVEQLPIPPHDLEFPLIVKPAFEDASVGIEQASVVRTPAALTERVDYVLNRYGPALVERFIFGREFNVSIIDDGQLRPLPIGEITFTDSTRWPIVSFDAKWRPGTPDFVSTPVKFPSLSVSFQQKIEEISLRAFKIVGCRQYARIDLRVDEAGQPYVLEVNPNPCISPLAGVAAAIERSGRLYADFIRGLVGNLPNRSVSTSDTATARPYREIRATDSGFDLLDSTGRLCGQSRFAPTETLGVYRLLTLQVEPPSRRLGWGRELLAATVERLQQADARLLLASLTSDPADAAGRTFLRKHKFYQVGDIPDFYGNGTAKFDYVRYLRESPQRHHDDLMAT